MRIRDYLIIAPLCFCLSLAVLVPLHAQADTNFARDKLIEDVRRLAHILETAHPDPYFRGGGKIAFHRRLQETLHGIPEQGMTKTEFYRLIAPFLAAVGDGHTSVYPPYALDYYKPGGLPLGFWITGEYLYVVAVTSEEHRNLIGSRLVSVEGISVPELVRRQMENHGTESEYGAMSCLCQEGFWFRQYLEVLLPEWKQTGTIAVELDSPSGERNRLELAIPKKVSYPLISNESTVALPATDKCDFAYHFVDDERKTALLRIDGMSGYREAFEIWGIEYRRKSAEKLYRRYNETDPPDDPAALLAGLPSATEVFRSLVTEMKAAGTEALLVDLRWNSGGNSMMYNFLLYLLFGRDRLLESKLTNSSEIVKYSEMYFASDRGDTLAQLNEGRTWPYEVNDYNFDGDPTTRDPAERRARNRKVWDDQFKKMPTFYDEYTSEEFNGYYCPEKLVVLCTPKTYSSGYTMMIRLRQFGAAIVGTPSAQAGNCFGDILRFTLENTSLSGQISHKQFIDFPDDPETGRVLRPDYVLSYEKLAEYGYDMNADLLYAFDLLPQIASMKR